MSFITWLGAKLGGSNALMMPVLWPTTPPKLYGLFSKRKRKK